MTIRREPSGRYRAVLKNGRQYVAGKTFDTKREATAWLARERAALAGGIDPRSGKERVSDLLPRWLEIRRTTVAMKTYRADSDLARLMPTSLQALSVASITDREIARSFEHLLKSGLSEGSVIRYRASLSTFFAWCVREKLVVRNAVTGVRVPRQSVEATEMEPWTEEELDAVHASWRTFDKHLADVLLVLGWTGLRWAEARSIRVGDLIEVPTPGLMVRRSDPEGVGVKSTKGRRSRRVPLANKVLSIVRAWAEGKEADDLLITTSRGAQLHRSAVLRSVKWEKTSQGRRLHDLRHTAACLWLARGVDPGTVQAWMGHESIATTNRYLHFLGTSADSAGLDRLNRTPGHAGGTHGREEAP